jgi:hypothetical protein
MTQIQNFDILRKIVTSGIKIRKNSIISIRNNILRNSEVIRLHTKDMLIWKKKRKYGHRWMYEQPFQRKRECLKCICH